MPRPDLLHGFAMDVRIVMFTGALVLAGETWGGELGGSGPLRQLSLRELERILPAGATLMTSPASVEEFLTTLEGKPPDWNRVYGHGHHDPDHDDRLFTLNRERDGKREGNPALSRQIAFVWVGVLSRYDPEVAGFPVALGPKFIKTTWGMVRFKPEEAPSNLSVTTDASQRIQFERLLDEGQPVEIDVVMTGRLIPEESVVYDFSHDEEGLGLIMPFVRVEQVEFVMSRP